MIPKIIHYCWFGNGEKPKKVQGCIDSWKKVLKDYQIIEWNEENFDIDEIEYAAQAYREKKYAFVSDVARLKALKEFGGIYLDTDVEVIKPFDEFLENKCVFGLEEKSFVATSFIACEQNFPLINQFYEEYKTRQFSIEGGTATNVRRLTEIMLECGFVREDKLQRIGDITIYPQVYFSPYDYINCIDGRTEDTVCVHHFFVSWMPITERVKKLIKRMLSSLIGKRGMERLRGNAS